MATNQAVVKFGVGSGDAFKEVVNNAKVAGEQVAEKFGEGVKAIERLKVPDVTANLRTGIKETITVSEDLAASMAGLAKAQIPTIDVTSLTTQVSVLTAQIEQVAASMAALPGILKNSFKSASDVSKLTNELVDVAKATKAVIQNEEKFGKATADVTPKTNKLTEAMIKFVQAAQKKAETSSKSAIKVKTAVDTEAKALNKATRSLADQSLSLTLLADEAANAKGNMAQLDGVLRKIEAASGGVAKAASNIGTLGGETESVAALTGSLNAALEKAAATTGLTSGQVQKLKAAYANLSGQFTITKEAAAALAVAEREAISIDAKASVTQFETLATSLSQASRAGQLTATSINKLRTAAETAVVDIKAMAAAGASTEVLTAQFGSTAGALSAIAAAAADDVPQLVSLATIFEQMSTILPGLSTAGIDFALAIKQIATSSSGAATAAQVLKLLGPALKEAKAQADRLADSESKVEGASKAFSNALKRVKQRLDAVNAAMAKNPAAQTVKNFNLMDDAVRQLGEATTIAEAGLIGVATASSRSDAAIKKFSKDMVKAAGDAKKEKVAINDLVTGLHQVDIAAKLTGIKKSNIDTQAFATTLAKSGITAKQAAAIFNKLGLSTKNLAQQFQQAGNAAGIAGAKFRKGISGLLAVGAAQARFLASGFVLFAVIGKIGEGLKRVVEQEKALARVQSVLNDSTKTLASNQQVLIDAMDKVAITLGATIEQSAEALFQLGSAGLSTEESIAALQTVMNLSIGTNAEAGDTARSVAGIYKNLSDEARNAGSQVEVFTHITDLMGRSFKDNLVDTKALVEGLKFVAGTTANFGITLEQTLGVLNTFNNNLLRGGLAGRAFRAILTRMATSTKELQKGFGITFDPNNFDSFLDAFDVINDKLAGIDAGQARIELKKIFGVRQASNVLILAKNIDSVRKNIKNLEVNAAGTADAMAKIKTTKLSQELLILQERFKLLVQGSTKLVTFITSEFLKALSGLIDGFIGINKALVGLPGLLVELVGGVLLLKAAFKALIIFANEQKMLAFGAALIKVGSALKLVNAAAAGEKLAGAIKGVAAATAEAEAAGAAISLSVPPLLLVVGAITAVVAAYKILKNKRERALEVAKEEAAQIEKGITIRTREIAAIRRIIAIRAELAKAQKAGNAIAIGEIQKRIESVSKFGDVDAAVAKRTISSLDEQIVKLEELNREEARRAFAKKFKEQLDALERSSFAIDLLDKRQNEFNKTQLKMVAAQEKLVGSSKDLSKARRARREELDKLQSKLENVRQQIETSTGSIKLNIVGVSEGFKALLLNRDIDTSGPFKEMKKSIEDAGGPLVVLNNLSQKQKKSLRLVFDALKGMPGAFDAWVASEKTAAKITNDLIERMAGLTSSSEVLKSQLASLIKINDAVDQAVISNLEQQNKATIDALRARGEAEKDVANISLALDAEVLQAKIASFGKQKQQADTNARAIAAIEKRKNKELLSDAKGLTGDTEKLAKKDLEVKEKLDATLTANAFKQAQQELAARQSLLSKLEQARSQSVAKQLQLEKKLAAETKAAQADVVRAVAGGQALIADTIRQGESAADKFDSTLSGIKKSLTGAQGFGLIDPEAAQRSIERAKSLFGELATTAISENGKIIQSDEDVRDARISIAKKIALTEESLARNRLANVGLPDQAADIQESLQQQIADAKSIQQELDKEISSQGLQVKALIGKLQEGRAEFAKFVAAAQAQAVTDLGSDVVKLATAMGDIAKVDVTKPIDDLKLSSQDAASSVKDLITKLHELQLLQQFVGPQLPKTPPPTSHSGSLVPGRGEQLYKVLGHEYIMPPAATDYYGETIFNMMRSKTLPKSLFQQPSAPAAQGGVIIQITPEVLKTTKNMTEDEIRHLTRRIARSLESEMSRTHVGKGMVN